jgi:hypothetical protein
MKKIIVLLSVLLFVATTSYCQTIKTIDRDSFSLIYPDSWTIDKTDEDYDPDALFSLDASKADGASMMFMIFSLPLDADEMLNEQVKTMTKALVKNPTSITDFDTWGNLKGKGKIIKGKLMGIFKGHIKLFMYTDDSKSMLVMEQLYDADVEKVAADFLSIANSFKFK